MSPRLTVVIFSLVGTFPIYLVAARVTWVYDALTILGCAAASTLLVVVGSRMLYALWGIDS